MAGEICQDGGRTHQLFGSRFKLCKLYEFISRGVKFESNWILNKRFFNKWEHNESPGRNLEEPLKRDLAFSDAEVCKLYLACAFANLKQGLAFKIFGNSPVCSVNLFAVVFKDKRAGGKRGCISHTRNNLIVHTTVKLLHFDLLLIFKEAKD